MKAFAIFLATYTCLAALGAGVALSPSPAAAAARGGISTAPADDPSAQCASPAWPEYDEIVLVVEKKLMDTIGGFFRPAVPLSAATWITSIGRLRRAAKEAGQTDFPPLPQVADLAKPLSRQEAVDLLVRGMFPENVTPQFNSEMIASQISDYGRVDVTFQRSIALAAEHGLIPDPLQPTAPADRAFGARLLVRVMPWTAAVSEKSVFEDEIRRAVSLHIFYLTHELQDTAPITTAILARAIARARVYLSSSVRSALPPLPVDSPDHHFLTRLEATKMVVSGLVADSRINPETADFGRAVLDPAVQQAIYLVRSGGVATAFADGAHIADADQLPIGVASYKGWIPNLEMENGCFNPMRGASVGYCAALLSRATRLPGEYTGVILDMTGLRAHARNPSVWVIGDGPEQNARAAKVYPVENHMPTQLFYTAPGIVGYCGSIDDAVAGRAGSRPFIIKAINWQHYRSDGTVESGGGVMKELDRNSTFPGMWALVISDQDAQMLSHLDRIEMLLRTGKVTVVHPDFKL